MLNADGKYFGLMFHKSCFFFLFLFHAKRFAANADLQNARLLITGEGSGGTQTPDVVSKPLVPSRRGWSWRCCHFRRSAWWERSLIKDVIAIMETSSTADQRKGWLFLHSSAPCWSCTSLPAPGFVIVAGQGEQLIFLRQKSCLESAAAWSLFTPNRGSWSWRK